MVTWGIAGESVNSAPISTLAPSLDRESQTMIGDPRAWGFSHGVRRPRLPFAVAGAQRK